MEAEQNESADGISGLADVVRTHVARWLVFAHVISMNQLMFHTALL